MRIAGVQVKPRRLFIRGIRAGMALLALAMPLMLLAPDARAQTSPPPKDFACKTIRVKLNGPTGALPLENQPRTTMEDILRSYSLRLIEDNADIELTFSVTNKNLGGFPNIDPWSWGKPSAVRSKEEININGSITSSKIASDSITLKEHSYDNGTDPKSYGPKVGWNKNGDDYITTYLKNPLEEYLKTYRAGIAIDVTPKDAQVQFKINGADVTNNGSHFIGCLKSGDKVAVTATRDGYKPLAEQVYEAAEGPSAVKKVELLPEKALLTPPTPLPASIIPWIVGALLAVLGTGLAIAWLWRKRNGRSNSQLLPSKPWDSRIPGSPDAVGRRQELPGMQGPPEESKPRDSRIPGSRPKLLFLSANQNGTRSLRIAEEIREIRLSINRVEDLENIDFIDVTWYKLDDVLKAFNEHKPEVVHLSCHGNRDGLEVVEKLPGALASKTWLESLFNAVWKPKLLVLSACYSDAVGGALHKTVGMTIGTTGAVLDQRAIEFARRFYGAVSRGNSVQAAFRQGKLTEIDPKERFATKTEDTPRGRIIRVWNTERPEEMFVLRSRKDIDPANEYLVKNKHT